MITCSVCGHLNDPERVTCEECGSDLSDSPDWIGYDDDEDDDFNLFDDDDSAEESNDFSDDYDDSSDDFSYDNSEDLGYYDDGYYD